MLLLLLGNLKEEVKPLATKKNSKQDDYGYIVLNLHF